MELRPEITNNIYKQIKFAYKKLQSKEHFDEYVDVIMEKAYKIASQYQQTKTLMVTSSELGEILDIVGNVKDNYSQQLTRETVDKLNWLYANLALAKIKDHSIFAL